METCKRKGREVLELAIDQLVLEQPIENKELMDALINGDESALKDHFQKMKKEELVDLLLKTLAKK
ncbi:MAG: hypothetical protein HKN32_03360 [Flavobacteriales bacterium]|nr:hypothetical protein [Flavobacteriales bacterium]